MADTDPRLALDFCGMPFATPLVLLSGLRGIRRRVYARAGLLQS